MASKGGNYISDRASEHSGGASTRASSNGDEAHWWEEDEDGALDSRNLLTRGKSVVHAVYGVLFTLAKEKPLEGAAWVAVVKVFLDFLQLLMVLISSNYRWYPFWDVYTRITWLYTALSYLNFQTVINMGYTVYMAIMYIVGGLLILSVALCVYVGWCFRTNNFPAVWPVWVLRVAVGVFFQTFYISSMSIFLVSVNCHWVASSSSDYPRGYLNSFPDKSCTVMPQLANLIVACILATVFTVISLITTSAEFELNPVSKAVLAASHSRVEMMVLSTKVVIILATVVVINDVPKLQVLVFAAAFYLQCFVLIRWPPHVNAWMNNLRTGFSVALAWVATILMINTFMPGGSAANMDEPIKTLTMVMLYLLGPMVVVGYGVSALRIRISQRRAWSAFSRDADAGTTTGRKLKDVFKFADEWEVELVARVCRKPGVEPDTHDSAAMDLAEQVIKAGMLQFPASAFLRAYHANFLIDVRLRFQAGYSALNEVKKMQPGWVDGFVLFIREQQRMQQSHAQATGVAMVDLVSYVEFQRNFRILIRAHQRALAANQSFWKLLLHSKVHFSSLTKAFSRIEDSHAHAEATYRMVLERYPHSAKLLRSYARFQEDVMNNPWKANSLFHAAEKLEESQAALNDMRLLSGDNNSMLTQVDEKRSAVAVINANGILQLTNRRLQKMFGYKASELEGKNVSMLMPGPFSQRHNGYISNYILTGKAKILDSVRSVVGLHKQRYVFPLHLAVSQISGSDVDSVFLGVLQEVKEEENVVRCWSLPDGTMLCVDRSFEACLGFSTQECMGRPLRDMVTEQYEISRLLDLAAQLEVRQDARWVTEKTHANVSGTMRRDTAAANAAAVVSGNCNASMAGSVIAHDDGLGNIEELLTGKGMHVIHKYTAPVIVDCSVARSGTPEMFILVFEFKPREITKQQMLLVLNRRGAIVHASDSLAGLLGYGVNAMSTMTLAQLLPQPFKQLHTSSMRDLASRSTSLSCREGGTVIMTAANRALLPVKLRTSHKFQDEETLHIVQLQRSSVENVNAERGLSLEVDSCGNIVSVLSPRTPPQLFGVAPKKLVGMRVVDLLDKPAAVGLATDPIGLTMGIAALANMCASCGSLYLRGAMVSPAALGTLTQRSGLKPPPGLAGRKRAPSGSGGLGGLQHAAQAAAQPRAVVLEWRINVQDGQQDLMMVMEEEETPNLILTLWCAVSLTGLLEVDNHGTIHQAGVDAFYCAGPIFGMMSDGLINRNIREFIHLQPGVPLMTAFTQPPPAPPEAGAEPVTPGTPTKSAMKKKPPSRKPYGPILPMRGVHSDAQPLHLWVQGIPRDGSMSRLFLRVQMRLAMPAATEPGPYGASRRNTWSTIPRLTLPRGSLSLQLPPGVLPPGVPPVAPPAPVLQPLQPPTTALSSASSAPLLAQAPSTPVGTASMLMTGLGRSPSMQASRLQSMTRGRVLDFELPPSPEDDLIKRGDSGPLEQRNRISMEITPAAASRASGIGRMSASPLASVQEGAVAAGSPLDNTPQSPVPGSTSLSRSGGGATSNANLFQSPSLSYMAAGYAAEGKAVTEQPRAQRQDAQLCGQASGGAGDASGDEISEDSISLMIPPTVATFAPTVNAPRQPAKVALTKPGASTTQPNSGAATSGAAGSGGSNTTFTGQPLSSFGRSRSFHLPGEKPVAPVALNPQAQSAAGTRRIVPPSPATAGGGASEMHPSWTHRSSQEDAAARDSLSGPLPVPFDVTSFASHDDSTDDGEGHNVNQGEFMGPNRSFSAFVDRESGSDSSEEEPMHNQGASGGLDDVDAHSAPLQTLSPANPRLAAHLQANRSPFAANTLEWAGSSRALSGTSMKALAVPERSGPRPGHLQPTSPASSFTHQRAAMSSPRIQPIAGPSGADDDEPGNFMFSNKPDDADAGAKHQADFHRGRRLRSVQKVLGSEHANIALRRFKWHSMYLTAAMITVHIVCFIVMTYLLNELNSNISAMGSAGTVMDYALYTLMHARVVQQIVDGPLMGYPSTPLYNASNLQYWLGMLGTSARLMEASHEANYQVKLRSSAINNLWDSQTIVVEYLDYAGVVPVYHTDNESLWEMGNNMVAYCKLIQTNYNSSTFLTSQSSLNGSLPLLANTREFRYLHEQAASDLTNTYTEVLDGMLSETMNDVNTTAAVTLVMLVVEAICLCGAACAFMVFLIRNVNKCRYRLFSVFITIPNATIRQLAAKEMDLDTFEDRSETQQQAGDHDVAQMDEAMSTATPMVNRQHSHRHFASGLMDSGEHLASLSPRVASADMERSVRNGSLGAQVNAASGGSITAQIRSRSRLMLMPFARDSINHSSQRVAPAKVTTPDGQMGQQQQSWSEGNSGRLDAPGATLQTANSIGAGTPDLYTSNPTFQPSREVPLQREYSNGPLHMSEAVPSEAGRMGRIGELFKGIRLRYRRRRWGSVGAEVAHPQGTNAIVSRSHKVLATHRWQSLWLLTPWVLWATIFIALYATSYALLMGLRQPVASVNAVNFLTFRMLQFTYQAHEAAVMDNWPQMDLNRELMEARLALMHVDYHVVLYGASEDTREKFDATLEEEKALANTTVSKNMMNGASLGVTHNPLVTKVLYHTTECLRSGDNLNDGPCMQRGTPYYQVTHMGVDAMMAQLLLDADLMVKDPASWINASSPRLQYAWMVSRNDLRDGLEIVASHFSDGILQTISQVKDIQIAMLVCCSVLALAFALFMVRPFNRYASKESMRAAKMLAELPNEVDIQALVEQAVLVSDAAMAAAAGGMQPQGGKDVVVRGGAANRIAPSFLHSASMAGIQGMMAFHAKDA